MALYVGEAIRIRVEPIDPDTNQPLDPPPSSAEVSFWAPGRNPAKDPTVRATPDYGPFDMGAYDAELNGFTFYIETEGWTEGKWSYQVKIVGASSLDNWEYSTFKLSA